MKSILVAVRAASFIFVLGWSCLSAIAQNVIAALPYASGVVNFNSYNPSSAINALSTIPAGWSFSCTGAAAYNGQSISGNAAGGYYAYTNLLSGDYNLGAQRDAVVGDLTYQVNYTNATGGLITTLVLSWNYEQWRFANTSGWTCYGTGALAGNSTLPTKGYVGANSSLLNLPTTTAVNAFTLSGLSIPDGANFGIAWTTNDVAGADNGVAVDDFSLSASAVASILVSGSLAAGTIYQTSVNSPLYRADATVGVTPSTLTAISFTTAGSYAATDLVNLKLWYSANAVFSPTATLLATRNGTLGPGVKNFTGLSQSLPVGTAYFFLTADVACTGSGTTIYADLNLAGLSFSNGVKSNAGLSAGGTQYISTILLSAVGTRTACSGKTAQAITFTTQPTTAGVSWVTSGNNVGLPATGTGNIAAFTTPTVSSNTSAVVTATASSGACVGNTVSFVVQIKNNGQSSTVWTGNVSGDWTDADNWTNCACSAVTDATIAAVVSPAFNPTLGVSSDVKHLTIDPGAQLTALSGRTLNVRGNWLNHGGFNAAAGTVLFSGSGQQSVGGTSVTSFYNLVLNNSNGAVFTSGQQLSGNLSLLSGALNTNNLFTLTATSGNTGRIGPISSSADILNNVTVQQLAPGGSTGWALLGSSISSTLNMTAWNDNFAITCVSCPNGYYNFTSIYTYDESAAGSYSASAKYIPISSIGDNLINGRGYWVYLGNGFPSTSDILFDVTGPVAKSSCISCSGAVTLPVSFTSNNGPTDDGWNLIANPLPSPISWTALRSGNASVDNAIYVYNADLNGGLGAHTSFVNGVSSNPGSGVSDTIAIHQGFYIHATAATQLTAGENTKVNATPLFVKPAQTAKPVFRLVMADSLNFRDMAAFYFDAAGDLSFQPEYDAYKFNFDESTSPYVASMSGTVALIINGLPPLTTTLTIPVKAVTPVTRRFIFSGLGQDFPNFVCVRLYDAYTGETTNLATNNYTCTLYDTTTSPRFTISFYTGSATGSSTVNQPNCIDAGAGKIVALGAGAGPWNYTWKSAGSIVRAAQGQAGADSLVGLPGGLYNVTVSTVGQCDLYTDGFQLQTYVQPQANFVASTYTAALPFNGQVSFLNLSQLAEQCSWSFGDGTTTSAMGHPSHSYVAAGNYTVTLVATSSTGCTDTLRQQIEVIGESTGLLNIGQEQFSLLTLGQGQYRIYWQTGGTRTLQLHDMSGKALLETTTRDIEATIDMGELPSGYYLLTVTEEGHQPVTNRLLR